MTSQKTLIIAEAGVNHNGSLERALKLVDVAAEASADYVKFQTFKAESVASAFAPKADYQKATTGEKESQLEMLRKLELDSGAFKILIDHCQEKGIKFLSTPGDEHSVDFLVDTLGLQTIKVGSGEITNAPLLLHIGKKRTNVILSTGMSTLGEIEEALGALAFGFLNSQSKPSLMAFKDAYVSEEGQKILQEKVTLLHCTTEYPAPFSEVNLNVMKTMRQAFNLPVGYSDHTEGISVPVAAAAMGASVIEKHFTLDRNLPGPDHKASLEPEELAEMVRSIRQIEKALGSSKKIPGPTEIRNLGVARKSLVAKRAITKGEIFTEENVTCKRPGIGLSPMMYWDVIGKNAPRNFEVDEVIEI